MHSVWRFSLLLLFLHGILSMLNAFASVSDVEDSHMKALHEQ